MDKDRMERLWRDTSALSYVRVGGTDEETCAAGQIEALLGETGARVWQEPFEIPFFEIDRAALCAGEVIPCAAVLYAQPIADCLRAVQKEVQEQGRPAPHIVFLTAGGQRYTEEHARRLAQYDNLTLVCGHYEGIDERVIDAFADEEISIGDYILTGGEPGRGSS